jgi:carboxyl-terminal processing protease
MSLKSFKAPKSIGLPITVIAALVLSLFVFLHPREARMRAKRIQRSAATASGTGSPKINEAAKAILLDSIVSLVQNYYVDSDRVESDRLISGTMRSLAYAIPELRFDESPTNYSLSMKSETLEFARDQGMEYDVLLGHLKSLIAFCERIHVDQLMDQGENIMLGDERNSTSIVLNALLSSLDAHSSLLSTDGYQDLRQGTEGAFGGLGVLVGVRDNVLTVLKPLPNSPAFRKGVHKDDKILSIDGFSTYGKSLDALVSHMRGEPGSSAQLVTLRAGEWAPKTQALQREVIEVNSVEAFEYTQGSQHILRLLVESFAVRTSKEIVAHIQKFRKKYPVGGVVLDLRGNPGGLLDQAVVVSDIFLDKGVVVTTRGRTEEIERAGHAIDEVDFPLAVLMDEGSASASEIVAGALQDNGRAVVIGQPSFGKGSVQTVFELPEMRALKLTIARYFTPANKSIQNVGIQPDVWLQPVYQKAENANMFGPYRYRNEQFLPNRLGAIASTGGSSNASSLKGYYISKDPQDSGRTAEMDPEMSVAMAIFGKVSEIYGASLPVGARRASHWLALSAPTIKGTLSKMSQTAISWLEDKHKVGWKSAVARNEEGPLLSLQIIAPSSGIKSTEAGMLEVPWKVTNGGTRVAENVSVFIQSPVSGLETMEALVGAIDGGQVREGVFKVKIPQAMVWGRHYVNAGIAIDAQSLPNAQGEFLIDVVEHPLVQLSTTVEFIDGTNGVIPQVIESKETAKFRVVVSNKTEADVKDVQLTVSNLAGSQIVIPNKNFPIGTIAAGSEKEILVPVVAKEYFESATAIVGFAVKPGFGGQESFAVSEVRTAAPLAAKRDTENLSH